MTILITFIQKAITQGIPMLFGATGEIITEKSGNLNLGIPGMMYMGGIGGLTGAFLYENSTANPNGIIGMIIAFICAFLAAAFGGLIYSVLTTTLRANQNVTGLALTTFGVGLGNFLGGSLSKLAGTVGQITVYNTGKAFQAKVPFLSTHLGVVGDIFFSYGFLTYLSIVIAFAATWFLKRTRTGLSLRAVGENPATADAAGINVTRYKYLATCIGGGISGLGGLYFVMEYLGGTWQNNAFGDRGWLAIALVIFALWSPARAIWGSILFGGLYIIYLHITGLLSLVGISYYPSSSIQEIYKMLPYIVTIIVLVITSLKKSKENQPPASLGLAYFREER